uniref:polo kinase n=1 Tax=Strongyloides venezuelensis TaxID=75913 RepID=A0A0K0G290_STRVS
MKSYDKDSEEVPEIIFDHKTGTRYCRGKLLRYGSFRRYYQFTNLKTGEKCVGKVIVKSKLNGMLEKIREEKGIHMCLEHPNILRMFHYFCSSTYVYITLELWDNTLGCVLERLKILDEPSCRFVVREVARGISYLHEEQLIHRDIKPANIFLTMGMDVKIGDFGTTIRNNNIAEKIKKACGTPEYLAPESLDGSGYSFGVDVWALGVTLYTMAVGDVPFVYTTERELYEKIKRCEYHIPLKVPVHTSDMIRILLDRNPDSRPGIENVLKHDYLNPETISKSHFLRYIHGVPFVKIGNHIRPHEYNVMAFTKNKNIPVKDWKLDSSHRIEEIFQKEFNTNNNYGNKNIPPKKGELNVEEESNYLLKDLYFRISILVGSSGPKELLPPFQIGNGLSNGNRSKYFVSRWMILNEKNGFVYQLSDSSVGVVYRDNTRLIVDCTMKNFQYIDERNVREYFEYYKSPSKLDKKLNLLGYFNNHMEMNSLFNPPMEEQDIGIVDGGIPVLLKWKKYDGFICFLLSNGILQVSFFDSPGKFIVSGPTESISIIGEDNRLETYSIKKLSLIGLDEVLKKRILFVLKVIEDWTPLKRKHGCDNDDVVPAKKK